MIHSAGFISVIDANVLYPVVIRDYLLWLAHEQLFTPKWSNKLLEEFSEVFAKAGKNFTEDQIQIQVNRMTSIFPSAIVDNYENIIPSITLPDEHDRHVMAAAVKCNANIIVTRNLKDFPEEYLEQFSLRAIDPDNFIADMIDLNPNKCVKAYRKMVLTKKNPPYDEIDYLDFLRNAGLEESATLLRPIL